MGFSEFWYKIFTSTNEYVLKFCYRLATVVSIFENCVCQTADFQNEETCNWKTNNSNFYSLNKRARMETKPLWSRIGVRISWNKLGAVHKLCRLKTSNFWPPPSPFFINYLPRRHSLWTAPYVMSWKFWHKSQVFSNKDWPERIWISNCDFKKA